MRDGAKPHFSQMPPQPLGFILLPSSTLQHKTGLSRTLENPTQMSWEKPGDSFHSVLSDQGSVDQDSLVGLRDLGQVG